MQYYAKPNNLFALYVDPMILLFGSWRLNWVGKENTGWATLVPMSQPLLHSQKKTCTLN